VTHVHTRYPGFSCCIYRGSTGRRLTDEHILSYGLCRQHVIENAS